MKPKTNPSAQRFLTQQIAMIKQTKKNMEKVKRNALAVQTETIRGRDTKHAEISRRLEETVTLVEEPGVPRGVRLGAAGDERHRPEAAGSDSRPGGLRFFQGQREARLGV
jgi:hypothetical protein